MKQKNVLFAGLPITGKTTYIAALWYYIFQSPDKSDFIVKTQANEEREYLNTISLEWAGCKEVQRTSQSIVERVSITMQRLTNGEIVNLSIPDISGETFRSQFKSREWDEEFDQIIQDIHGILLFIDPMDEKNTPKLIYHNNQYYRIFDEKPPIPTKKETWSVDFVPNQVKLVDFLQMVNYRSNRPFKLSVIISCWDLVEVSSQPKLPKEWCKITVPLLYQYLEANSEIFETKYFGVSAQGGSYDVESVKVLSKKEPIDRIKIVDDSSMTNEILRPILWVTDEN